MLLVSKRMILVALVITLMLHAGAIFAEEGVDNWYHYEQGMRMLQVKNYQQAEKEFRYYQNHPEYHRHMFGVSHFGLGLMQQSMGRNDLAIEEFKLAIENDLHPVQKVSDSSYINIGAIYLKRKAYQDAITTYSKAIEINPKNGVAHYYLGVAYLRTGEYEKAEKEGAEAKKLGVPFTGIDDELAERKKSSSKDADAADDQPKAKGKKSTKKKAAH
ncbi:MAG: tetratricopeptide repeat protein [Desulfuromonadales bacterium]|nr:MAG: tetratricopeptide repeat protein [Desulfuromonadales bacterium]